MFQTRRTDGLRTSQVASVPGQITEPLNNRKHKIMMMMMMMIIIILVIMMMVR